MEAKQKEVSALLQPPALTFERMDELIDTFHGETKGSAAGRAERAFLYTGLSGATLAMLAIAFAPENAAGKLVIAGFLLELVGLSTSVALMLRREWHSLRRAKRAFAQELDRDYAKYLEYVQSLQTYQRRDRDRRLRYMKGRRDVMRYRMGLLTGGVERLGLLPLGIALYLQFKDWEFGDWATFGQITLMQVVLAWLLLLLYAGGWHLIRLYSRVEAYEQLLTEAAAQDDELSIGRSLP